MVDPNEIDLPEELDFEDDEPEDWDDEKDTSTEDWDEDEDEFRVDGGNPEQ